VLVDADTDLGTFSECSGLSAGYGITELREGGENGFAHQLWGPVSYGKITLVRALDAASAAVAEWVTSFEAASTPATARIEAVDPAGASIAAWDLRGVVPVQWNGPTWNVAANAVARETLVIAHTGFTRASGGGGAA
jgi:phage tail-like protein